MEIGFLSGKNLILQHKFYTTTHMTHDVILGIPFLRMHHSTFDWTSGKVYFKKTNTEAIDLRKDKILECSKAGPTIGSYSIRLFLWSRKNYLNTSI
jgi:hypothetical protein